MVKNNHALTITTIIGTMFLTSMIISIHIHSAYARGPSSLFGRANGLLPLPNILSSSPSSDRGSEITPNVSDNSNNVSPNAGGGNNKIPDGSITTSKLADGAVTNPKLAPDAVTSDKIQVNTDDIASDAITGNKIPESFMKRVTLADDSDGNSKGWNPNGVGGRFDITDPSVSRNSIVVVNTFHANTECSAFDVNDGTFSVHCGGSLPANGSELHYLIINLPQSQS